MAEKDTLRVILGVSGSIAAYKACSVVRGLVHRDCDVRVVMTDSAQRLVGSSTFRSLSGRPVTTTLWIPEHQTSLVHIELAEWADVLAIVPATANVIGKFSCGIADDVLSTLWLAFDGAKLIAPAMNDRMWANNSVQRNVQELKEAQDVGFVGPVAGELASGKLGKTGRLAPVEEILDRILQVRSS